MRERTRERDATAAGDSFDRWTELLLVLACLVALGWIGFSLWLAAEVLGLV
jgi:hypothetical protein